MFFNTAPSRLEMMTCVLTSCFRWCLGALRRSFLCLSVHGLTAQTAWIPIIIPRDEGRKQQGQRGKGDAYFWRPRKPTRVAPERRVLTKDSTGGARGSP